MRDRRIRFGVNGERCGERDDLAYVRAIAAVDTDELASILAARS